MSGFCRFLVRFPLVWTSSCPPSSDGCAGFDAEAFETRSAAPRCGTLPVAPSCPEPRDIGNTPAPPGRSHFPVRRMAVRASARRSCARISLSLAAMRLPIVFRCTVKWPVLWLVPQMWVKPRKLKVSGFPSPRCLPSLRGIAPELDQARLLRVQFQPELPQAFPELLPGNRSASFRCSNPSTASSA